MISLTLAHSATSVLAAFLASIVEFVEALTIVLAVGTTRGWRPALVGTCLGAITLALLVAGLGPQLQAIPLEYLQLIVGILLLLFGFRWLRKAVLRSAGLIPLHDEDLIYQKERAALAKESGKSIGILSDPVGVLTSFKAVLLEGLEVVFIVLATGVGTSSLLPAIIGASLAGLFVIILGFALHRPLAKVPENQLKFAVGILLSAFGIFWVGEGFHYEWPGADLFIFVLVALLFGVAQIGISLAKRGAR